MKRNIKSIIIISVFSAITFSCGDFLTEEPFTILVPETIFNDINGATAALKSAYSSMKDGNMRLVWTMTNGRADNVTTRGSWAPVSDYTKPLNSTNITRSYNGWNSFYQSIGRCNTVIDRADLISLPESRESEREALIAEAKFVRAWNYYYLVRLYGPVPLRLREVTSLTEEVLNAPRMSEAEVYAQIESDLQEAEQKGVDSWGAADVGRGSKWIAKAMLADVYLTQGKWREAKEIANEVINSAKYNLVSVATSEDYIQIYGPYVVEHSEEILSFKFTNSVNGLGTWEPKFSGPSTRTNYTTGGSGWSGYLVNTDCPHVANWDDADLRKDWTTYSFWTDPATGEVIDIRFGGVWPMFRKYRDFDAPGWGASHGNDLPIYRLSDMLLIYAEASSQAAGGPDADAIEKLNMVKRRAYGYDVATVSPIDYPSSGWTQQTFRDAVLIERAYEFMLEPGKRWFDLKRTNTIKQAIEAAYPGQTYNDVSTFYPIPPEEIQNNDGMTEADQNPGY